MTLRLPVQSIPRGPLLLVVSVGANDPFLTAFNRLLPVHSWLLRHFLLPLIGCS